MDANREQLLAAQAGAAGSAGIARARPRRRAATRAVVCEPPWQRRALGATVLLAAALNLVWLNRDGLGNTYYAATVKSMLTSWHNFFFISYDPGGFVSVDKPPLGLWVQAVSAKLFGFHGLSLLLPQALAGILSVPLLYVLVRRVFGPTAGLLAALVLAVSPINVATDRSNTMDGLVALTLLLAAWAVGRATETGRLRLLLLGAALVGLGFNIKMLEAYLVVPALYALYLLGARLRWRTRLAHLALATVVLLVVSLSWAVTVDLTPAGQRPYVGSSDDNSELNLTFGYNGLERLLPNGWTIFGHTFSLRSRFGRQPSRADASATAGQVPPVGVGGNQGPGGNGENGARGPLRLLNTELGGQVGWLIPLAILGMIAIGWRRRPRLPLDRPHQALVLWGV